MRPLRSLNGISRCDTIARRFSERSISSCARFSSGKKLMMRSSAWLVEFACSVHITRWPVSAKAIACSIVSRSRTSPIRITSGAWRSVFFSATCQVSQSTPTSRCEMMQFLCGCTYSIGSSIVMMWPFEFSLRYPTIAASEVDLPEPVAPTTMMMPRLAIASSLIRCGRFSSSVVGMWSAIVRNTMPTLPCCTNAETRKRPMPVGLIAKLHSLVFSNSVA